MGLIIYFDGKFVPQEEAKVSVFDHGLLYGDGVFEGIRSYNGMVFRLTEHLERLYESAKSIMLNIPISLEEIRQATFETLRRNSIEDGYIRIVVTRGIGDLGLDPCKCPKPSVIIIASEITLFPKDFYENGLEVISVATRRNIADALDPRIKSLNYLNNILVKLEANKAGVLEAIMLNSNGYVTEGSGDNIFIVRKGKIITPPVYLGILEGITRQAVIDIAIEKNLPVVEQPFTRHDLYNADECFLTGSAAEIIPVVKVDNRVIGSGKPGPITWDLITAYRQLCNTTGEKA